MKDSRTYKYIAVHFMFALAFAVACARPCYGQHQTLPSASDRAWTEIETMMKSLIPMDQSNIERFRKEFIIQKNDSVLVALRDVGTRFFITYPQDKRRYEWLRFTINNSPLFARGKDAFAKVAQGDYGYDVDTESYRAWIVNFKTFESIYREHFFKSEPNNKTPILALSLDKLNSDLRFFRTPAFRPDGELFEKHVASEIEHLYRQSVNTGFASHVLMSADYLIDNQKSFNLSNNSIEAFCTELRASSVEELREWAQAKLLVMSFSASPMNFDFMSLDNDTVRVSDLRGKKVLLDFWATSCTTCIKMMPEIKNNYERYRDLGFQVVSVSLDSPSRRERVKKVETEKQISWPSYQLASKAEIDRVLRVLGFNSVPQMLLLDEEGRMIAGNSVLLYGKGLSEELNDLYSNK